jgi:DivIVA domain-containing protein
VQLDRRSIVRDDFTRARRGYDAEEVRRHLKQIADLVEELEQEHAMAPVADSAASQVRSILQAAERSRTKLESAAQEEAEHIREEAERIRAEAETEAEKARARAGEEAAERVQVVHAATQRVLERAEAIEQELAALQADAAVLGEAVRPARRRDEVERPEGRDGVTPDEEESAATPAAAGSDHVAPAADMEDIRLIALNMALNGSSRSETAAYLVENFEIEDPEKLLDGVYAEART